MKLTDKRWKRVLLVLTFPVWIVPVLVGVAVLLLLGDFIIGTYTFVVDGKWEDCG